MLPRAASVGAPIVQHSTTDDATQFLCAKYSALVTRLREETLARQQAEAQLRAAERQVNEQRSSIDSDSGRGYAARIGST